MFSDHDRVLTPEEVVLGKELKEILSRLHRDEKLKVIGFSAALATMQELADDTATDGAQQTA